MLGTSFSSVWEREILKDDQGTGVPSGQSLSGGIPITLPINATQCFVTFSLVSHTDTDVMRQHTTYVWYWYSVSVYAASRVFQVTMGTPKANFYDFWTYKILYLSSFSKNSVKALVTRLNAVNSSSAPSPYRRATKKLMVSPRSSCTRTISNRRTPLSMPWAVALCVI